MGEKYEKGHPRTGLSGRQLEADREGLLESFRRYIGWDVGNDREEEFIQWVNDAYGDPQAAVPVRVGSLIKSLVDWPMLGTVEYPAMSDLRVVEWSVIEGSEGNNSVLVLVVEGYHPEQDFTPQQTTTIAPYFKYDIVQY